jgi:hypothetical protein
MNQDQSPRLTTEIIPMSLHGINPRTVNGKAWWDCNRRKQYQASHYRCEICGGVGERHPVEAHERYEYDETARPPCQRLVGLIALCPDCHSVKHLYRTHAVSVERRDPSIYENALRHLARVNGWDDARVQAYLTETQAAFERREALGRWVYDYSAFPGV